jgi:hypothetical protein
MSQDQTTRTTHTPGPWREGPTEGIGQRGRLIVVDAAGQRVADCQADKTETGLSFIRPLDEDTANARLIASAPDLLAAAKHLGKEGHRFGSVVSEACADCIAARAAIQKAESQP